LGKYDGLTGKLRNATTECVKLTFDDINDSIKGSLPASAYDHRPFWENLNDPTGRVHNEAWDNAGFEVVEVNQAEKWVRFCRKK